MSLADIARCGSYDDVARELGQERSFSDEELARTLSAAVDKGDCRLLCLLLDHGANPNFNFSDAWPILHYAVEHWQLETIQLLVARGADVNIVASDGWTPLHHAADVEGDYYSQTGRISNGELISLLLRLGANRNVRTNDGKTPLDIAQEYNHRPAVALLTD